MKVDAVILSPPLLVYCAAHEGKGLVKTVGSDFNRVPIAITFQLDSPRRRKIDVTLLKLSENGTYQRLYSNWFGSPQEGLT